MGQNPSFGVMLVFVILLLIAGGAYLALCLGLGLLMIRLKRLVERRFFLTRTTNRIIVCYFVTQAVLGLAWMLTTVSSAGSKTAGLIELFTILAFVCVTGIFGAVSFIGA